MPIRNMGTLLENIVLAEAFRLLANNATTPIDFANSFAMPPLSPWVDHRLDRCFSNGQLTSLQVGTQPNLPGSYQGLMWSCLQQQVDAPGSRGPSGALLCAILAHQMNRMLRLWLNDIQEGHYGNALPGLAGINHTVQQVLGLPNAPANAVITCDQPYPESLLGPAHGNLQEAIINWGNVSQVRLGFLDPMRYRIANPNAGETASADHQRWLGILANAFNGTVFSVHFTGHRNHHQLQAELAQLHQDGVVQGYAHSLDASHGHYHVITNVRHPSGQGPANELALELCGNVRAAWNAWCAAINHAPCALGTQIR